MRTPAVVVAALMSGIALALPAAAAPPTHGENSETFSDANFCGTGSTVKGTFYSHFRESTRDGLTKVTHQGSVTYTSGDRSVTLSFAGQFSYETVQGRLDEIHVNLLTSKGMNTKLQIDGGRVLSLDAGLVSELYTLTPDDHDLSVEVVRVKGPHPFTLSHGAIFCDVVTGGLGLR